MSTHPIHVSEIAPQTSETHLHDFFSFCGKISSIEWHGDAVPKTAVIHFEKPSAAKTALMLNGGTLDGTQLVVTSEIAHQDEDDISKDRPIDQSDKPRAGIAAEYLAKGYVLSDHILNRAIEIDSKQGISKRFLNYVQSLDTSLGQRALGPDQTISGKIQYHLSNATQQARSFDESKGVTKTANDYYLKVFSSPLGKQALNFYTNTSKQVLDIHDEARRIAAQHKEQQGSAAASSPTATVQTGPATSAAPAPVSTVDPPAPSAPVTGEAAPTVV